MDIDATALWLALRSPKTFREAKDFGVGDNLMGAAKAAWKFCDEYVTTNQEVPGVSIVSEQAGVPIKPPDDGEEVTLKWVSEKLHERWQMRAVRHGLEKASDNLEEDDLPESIIEVHKLSDALKKKTYASARIHTLADIAPMVIEQYEATKRGVIGVPYPWDAMTRMTMGMWPGTLTFFVARPGVGKTWSAILIAMNAWQNYGKKVLIVSPELQRVELGERILAKYGGLSYGDMVQATLGVFQEKRLHESAKELELTNGFYVLDDENHLGSAYIEQAIDAIEPDIVLIDSVYMLKVENGMVKKGPGSKGGRYDRILDTMDWIRGLARRTNLPIVGISQLSRDAKTKKGSGDAIKKGHSTGGLEDAVAMSDTMLWDCQNLFAMWQDKDMAHDKLVAYVPLKVRRQVEKVTVISRFDMSTMDFSQVGTHVEKKTSYDDDDGESAY